MRTIIVALSLTALAAASITLPRNPLAAVHSMISRASAARHLAGPDGNDESSSQDDYDPMMECERAADAGCCAGYNNFIQLMSSGDCAGILTNATMAAAQVFSAIGDEDTDIDTSLVSPARIASTCTSSCLTQAKTALTSGPKMGPGCRATYMYNMYFSTLCEPGAGGRGYCAPAITQEAIEVQKIFEALFNDNVTAPPTQQEMQSFCGNDCIPRLVNKMVLATVDIAGMSGDPETRNMSKIIGPIYDRVLGQACLKNPSNSDQYCLPIASAALGGPNAIEFGIGSQLTNVQADTLCEPCVRLGVNSYFEMQREVAAASSSGSLAMVEMSVGMVDSFMKGGCGINPENGRRCSAIVGSVPEDLLTASGEACMEEIMAIFSGSAPTCTAGCQDALVSFFPQLGCCAPMMARQLFYGSIGLAMDNLPSDVDPMDLQNSFLRFVGTCVVNSNIADPAKAVCIAGTRRHEAALRLTGVNFDFVNRDAATLEAFKSNMQGDIAASLGVDPSLVQITGIRRGSVIVDFTVQGEDDDATAELAATLDLLVEEGGIVLTDTLALLLENEEDAFTGGSSASFGIEETTPEPEPEPEDAAASATVSVLAAVAVAAAAIRM